MLFLQADHSVEWATDKLGEGHHLVFQKSDGNLVIYKDSEAVWATYRTTGTPGLVVMQDDGNLVVYDAEHNPLWASKDPCNRSVLTAGDILRPGEKLCSPNRAYTAILQHDGNFVIYKAVS